MALELCEDIVVFRVMVLIAIDWRLMQQCCTCMLQCMTTQWIGQMIRWPSSFEITITLTI